MDRIRRVERQRGCALRRGMARERKREERDRERTLAREKMCMCRFGIFLEC